jgi:hypothetical protein
MTGILRLSQFLHANGEEIITRNIYSASGCPETVEQVTNDGTFVSTGNDKRVA